MTAAELRLSDVEPTINGSDVAGGGTNGQTAAGDQCSLERSASQVLAKLFNKICNKVAHFVLFWLSVTSR